MSFQSNDEIIYHKSFSYFRPSTLQTAQNTYSKRLVEKENALRRGSLPKAQSTSAPETAIRLTVFGTPDIINNLDETDMSESLSGIPVRLVLAKNLTELREKIDKVRTRTSYYVFLGKLKNSLYYISTIITFLFS